MSRFLVLILLVGGLLPELITAGYLLAPLLLLVGGAHVALASALLLLAYDRARFAPLVPVLLIAKGLAVLAAAAAFGAELSRDAATRLVLLLAPGEIPYVWLLLPVLLWDALAIAVLAGIRGAPSPPPVPPRGRDSGPAAHGRPEFRQAQVEIVDAPPRENPDRE